jgi:DNA-binding ferritin-like protein
MFINGRSYGFISMKNNDVIAPLSEKQTKALVTSLSRSSEIVWKYKEYHWKLSDAGSTAVLLKADEFQKRLHTQDAF